MTKRRNAKQRKPSRHEVSVSDRVRDADIDKVFSHALKSHQQGQLGEAAKGYQMILNVQPQHSEALHYSGLIAFQRGDTKLACELIERAIIRNAHSALYHFNLAVILQASDQLQPAISHYDRAIKLQQAYSEAYENMAICKHDAQDYSGAKTAYLQALKLHPDCQPVLINLATLLSQCGDLDASLSYLDGLIIINPMHYEARFKRAQLHWLTGNIDAAMQGFAWMYHCASYRSKNNIRIIPFRKYAGASLVNKRILINADQGIGDEIMFAGFLPALIAQAGSVVIECDARLLPLYRRSFPAAQLIARQIGDDFYWYKELGSIDYRMNVSELVAYFLKTQKSPAIPSRYLRPEADKVQLWQQRLKQLGEHASLNIGISWHGGSDSRTIAARSIPLSYWQTLAALDGINLVSLQYGQHDDEIADFNSMTGAKLHQFSQLDAMDDLDDLSALIAALDLVISIDNATVHLAGALGVPVWIILPLTPDWRWQLNSTDSDWYASAKLYRGQEVGLKGLRGQLETVCTDVQKLVSVYHKPERKIAGEHLRSETTTLAKTVASNTATSYALLLNDTSAWYHWGCSCTSLAIHDALRRQWPWIISIPVTATQQLDALPLDAEQFDDDTAYQNFCQHNAQLIQKIDSAAAVYINGEGTLHDLNPAALGLLYLAYIASKRLNKRVAMINHSCYPDGGSIDKKATASTAQLIYAKVYKALDYIAVREMHSLQQLEYLGCDAQQSFDSLPLYIEHFYTRIACAYDPKKTVVIAGSVAWDKTIYSEMEELIRDLHDSGYNVKVLIGAHAHIAEDDSRFVRHIHAVIGSCCELILASSEQQWLQTIDQAQLLISGRFHHSIAAAFLHTPFIVMASNTPKITAMLKMLELNCFIDSQSPRLADRLYAFSEKVLSQPEDYVLEEGHKQQMLALIEHNFMPLSAP